MVAVVELVLLLHGCMSFLCNAPNSDYLHLFLQCCHTSGGRKGAGRRKEGMEEVREEGRDGGSEGGKRGREERELC